jgi:FtsH-binding integral membrane protein
MQNIYANVEARPVAELGLDVRATFIARTYLHLFGAILGFTAIEIVLFQTGISASIAQTLGGNWLVVLGGFMLVSWLASSAAHRAQSLLTQYAALAGFVVAEAVIFVPLLYVAEFKAPGVIQSAAVITLGGFGLLTFIAFWTRKDFSFMGALLRWIGVAALLGIVASLIFGFQLGTWFSVGMIVFAGAAVLYDTSNVLHHYPADRHVAASLQLFASVAMMFWYVLRLMMSGRD